MIRRGQPGSRRGRSRRAEEAAALEALDPERAAELLELRRLNPQAFRKELRRLVRDGVIAPGRGWDTPQEALDLLKLPLAPLSEGVEAGLASGDFNIRTVAGLCEAEGAGKARSNVLGWLVAKLEALEDAENRSRETHMKTRAAAVRMRSPTFRKR